MRKRTAQFNAKWVISSSIGVALAAGVFLLVYFLQPSVDATEVIDAPVVEAFYATGTVSPQREYAIRAAIAGIVRVKVDRGAAVKQGQILAIVENSDLQFSVDQSKAELHRKELLDDDKTSPVLEELRSKLSASTDMLQIATDDQKRVISLRQQGGTSQSDLDTSMNRVKTQWSDVESLKSQIAARKIDLDRDVQVAQAALSSAQWNLDQATIKSPIDGTVLDWPTSDGTRVAANDHIMQLADVSVGHLVMRAQVDEEDKNKLRPAAPGQLPQVVKMTLYAYPNTILTGTLDKVYDKADPDRRTYEVDVNFDKPDPRLAPGMTGELTFIINSSDSAMVVPTQAVQSGSVMTIVDGKLQSPQITTGLRGVDRTEITSGLHLGDRIVISPTLGLSPGQRVRVRNIDPIIAGNINKPRENQSSFRGIPTQ